MKTCPGPLSAWPLRRLAVGLALAGGVAWPPLAGAQQAGVEGAEARPARAARQYACVEPSDVLARPRLQQHPCELPWYELPKAESPMPGERPRWQSGPSADPAMVPGHAMFWRFPVQGHGPHEVPRHTWR
jgi:hypothetical protein